MKENVMTAIAYMCLAVACVEISKAGPLDSLDVGEIDRAKRVLQGLRNTPRARAVSDSSASGTQSEILLIERRPVEKGAERTAPRLVDVYTYNFQTNKLKQTVIDINTNQVQSVTESQGTQLPLIQKEINQAIDLVFNDSQQLQLLNQEFQRLTGQTLTNVNQVKVKAFTFLGDSLPGIVNEDAKNCGIHRCAQLLLYTADSVAFEISPIIDLSIKRIIQNINF
jgi:Cu2+-containing amine oxidase